MCWSPRREKCYQTFQKQENEHVMQYPHLLQSKNINQIHGKIRHALVKSKKEKNGIKLWHNHFNILVCSVSSGLSRKPDGPGQQTEVPKQNTLFKSQHWCFLKIVWKISTAYWNIQQTNFFYFRFWVDEAWPDTWNLLSYGQLPYI